VFKGVLLLSSDRPRTLADLGLSPDRARLIDNSWFDAELSAKDRAAAAHVSLTSIARAYLRDPAACKAAGRQLLQALSGARWTRRMQREAVEVAEGQRRFFSSFWHYSGLRRQIVPGAWGAGAWLLVLSLWTLGSAWRRGITPRTVTFVTLLAILGVQSVAAIVGDGLFGIVRHLALARFVLDLALALLVCDAVSISLQVRPSPVPKLRAAAAR